MTAMLLTLTLAAPVPRPSAPSPSGFRDGMRATYCFSVVNIGNGQINPVCQWTHLTVRDRVEPNGDELFRIATTTPDSDAQQTEYVRVTADTVYEADATGRAKPKRQSRPRGTRAATAVPGDTRSFTDHEDRTVRVTFDGSEVISTPAGQFECVRERRDTLGPDGSVVEKSVSWMSRAHNVNVRHEVRKDRLEVEVTELTEFNPGR